jgi:DNA-binding beta-propeller fold protein YncE
MHPLKTIRVGNYPIGIAVDEKAGRIYVVNNREKSLSIIDETSLEVQATRHIPANVSNVALNSAAGLLYLALKGEDGVALVRVRDL